MKTIFDEAARSELINRVHTLSQNDTAQWGKMNVCQMLGHCTLWDAWILGKHDKQYKQAFIGKVFGKLALWNMTKDDRPIARNIPTSPFLFVKEVDTPMEVLKSTWVNLIDDYSAFSNAGFVHDFFGKMSEKQIGILAYKHTDHHLRQFNR